ncbi:hypothetical protein L6164_006331 [Bauhinia variegata]|uniref:Uncharacterized protein n=1 Tax=Bauhinia variegata TaxID=167791 RepID=A0ACB9PU31_BAUVA|nr:hypothetical protein L6164_006331 [Bauhinia variegata]
MAKRSDFAQKLLDDLRLRKQKMAASASASQRSAQSNQLPIDAYAYSKQTYRRFRDTKANDITSSRSGDMLNRSSRSHRSASIAEVSSEIVPYGHGRGQSTVEMGDMSLALAFAFENGLKLRRTDSSFTTSSIMGFLHQIKRGTIDFGKMEGQSNLDRQLVSTSYSTLSPVQINQIAKGAQKLNQILSFFSNGLNIDRNSIEFAKELLKGAMDLEDSLRMLVELQKTSEFMVTSQNKNRITLLEDDDNDDEKTIKNSEQKQLARPRFSFDKPSRHSQNPGEVGNTSLLQRSNALAYSKDGRTKNNEKNDTNTSKLLSHRRSASYSSAPAGSNPDKGRIPNVIAKLMGLDNLPQKESDSTKKTEGKIGTGRTKKFDQKNKQTENLVPLEKQKVIDVISKPVTKDRELMLGEDKNLIIQKADGIKTLNGSEKTTAKIDKKFNNAAQMNDVQVKEKRQDHTSSREQKGSGKGRVTDLVLNQMLEQAHERSQFKPSLQEEKESSNGSILQSERRYTNKHITNNQNKSQNHLGTQESYMLLKYASQEDKAHGEQKVQQSAQPMMQIRPQRRSDTVSKHGLTNSPKKQLPIQQGRSYKHNPAENVEAMRLEEFLNSHHDQLNRDEASTNSHVQMKEKNNMKSAQSSNLKDRKSEPVKGRSGLVTMMDERNVDKLANKKVKNTKMQKINMPGKIDKVLTGRKQVKHQSPILQEGRQTRYGMLNVSKEKEQESVGASKEADAHIISSSQSIVIEPLDVRHQTHEEAELPATLSSPDGRKRGPQEQEALVPNHSYQDVKSTAVNDLQDQVTLVAQDEDFKSCEIATNTINGIHEDGMDVHQQSQLEDQNISGKGFQEPLTESENHLKWILVMSQLFLNTAEALFRINIPPNILQGGGLDNHDEGSKLILDCGYEVMKRKGIRQELKVHSFSKISISTIKIGSLDDLVRLLNKDMEKLKSYGRNRSSTADVEECLPKMLEYDIYTKDPDIDCMWDLGWNDETLAFIEKYEVIRDMEKHMLNVLLDEIAAELCPRTTAHDNHSLK